VRRRAALPALAALAVVLARPSAAFEHTRFQPVVVASEEAAESLRVPATLNIPAGWQPGHGAAVLLFDPPAAPALRDSLLVALLDSGAAVLELDANTAHGFSTEADRDPPPPTAEGLVRDLAGALTFLREDAQAGVVVAIGHGLGGDAVMLAAATRGEKGGLAAHVSLGPGAPRFATGGPVPAAEGWPHRVPMLCESLAWAAEAVPTPVDPHRAATDRLAETARACAAALAPPELTMAVDSPPRR
jgi:pimeloyl-ACP methyl ester carboxylesterase